MRFILGLIFGFMAWSLMRLAAIMPSRFARFFETRAVLAACRMYRQGGGIDDGASYIVGTWGESGRSAIARLLQESAIPRKLEAPAKLLMLVEPEE